MQFVTNFLALIQIQNLWYSFVSKRLTKNLLEITTLIILLPLLKIKKRAEEKMKEINAAYDSIKEERSRPKPPPTEDFPFPPDFIDIILGRNRQKQTANNPTRGTDLRYDLTIELEEAAFGKETKINNFLIAIEKNSQNYLTIIINYAIFTSAFVKLS